MRHRPCSRQFFDHIPPPAAALQRELRIPVGAMLGQPTSPRLGPPHSFHRLPDPETQTQCCEITCGISRSAGSALLSISLVTTTGWPFVIDAADVAVGVVAALILFVCTISMTRN